MPVVVADVVAVVVCVVVVVVVEVVVVVVVDASCFPHKISRWNSFPRVRYPASVA